MLSLSPLSDMSAYEEYDTPRAESSVSIRSVSNSQMESDGISGRLAFTYDFSHLDEDGRPKSKLARKLSRNESEKMRRDRLNAYIAELARLVPLIFSSSRKLDKASILRLTVTYLKIYHNLIRNGRSKIKWRPDFLTYDNLGNLLLESINGFLLVVNQSGQLIFTTDAFTSILGHSLVDVLGISIYRILHPEDENVMMQQLKGFQQDGVERSGNRSFYVRMIVKTNKPTVHYENIHIVGHLKIIPATHKDPDLCLIGVGRVVTSETGCELCSIPDDNANQWITRHEMDGTITFSDQRGAVLTGFLPGESVGLPAYSLIHPEDVSSIVAVHNMILTTGSVPVTVFRMFTKSRDVLYIRNNTHIVVDMWTSKPKYIISINEVISEELGRSLLAEQHKKLKSLPSDYDCGGPCSSHCKSSNTNTEEASCETNSHIIPELVPEPSGNVSVIVGRQKYEISLSVSGQKICPKTNNKNTTDSSQPIFDPDIQEDDGGINIPVIKPVFLGDEGDCGRVGRSMYDDINTYMGNDPTLITPDINAANPLHGHQPDSDNANSALSSLHAMIWNPNYPTRPPKQQLNPILAPSKIKNMESTEKKEVPGSCHPALSFGDSTHSCTIHQGSNASHRSVQLQRNTQGDVFVPSTSTRHNPILLQLLNMKTSQDSHIRETVTSHLITDSSSLNGDRSDPKSGDVKNSSDLPPVNQQRAVQMNQNRELSNQRDNTNRPLNVYQHLPTDILQTVEELMDIEVKCHTHEVESNEQESEPLQMHLMTQTASDSGSQNKMNTLKYMSQGMNQRQQHTEHEHMRNKLLRSCGSAAMSLCHSVTSPGYYSDLWTGLMNKFSFDEKDIELNEDHPATISKKSLDADKNDISLSVAKPAQCKRPAYGVLGNCHKPDGSTSAGEHQCDGQLPVPSMSDLNLDDIDFSSLFDEKSLFDVDLNSFDSLGTHDGIASLANHSAGSTGNDGDALPSSSDDWNFNSSTHMYHHVISTCSSHMDQSKSSANPPQEEQ